MFDKKPISHLQCIVLVKAKFEFIFEPPFLSLRELVLTSRELKFFKCAEGQFCENFYQIYSTKKYPKGYP